MVGKKKVLAIDSKALILFCCIHGIFPTWMAILARNRDNSKRGREALWKGFQNLNKQMYMTVMRSDIDMWTLYAMMTDEMFPSYDADKKPILNRYRADSNIITYCHIVDHACYNSLSKDVRAIFEAFSKYEYSVIKEEHNVTVDHDTPFKAVYAQMGKVIHDELLTVDEQKV